MTAIPANLGALNQGLQFVGTPQDRAAAVDALVESNRAATPSSVADQRTVKRLSVGELNQLDFSEIENRFRRAPQDSRTSFVKFIDLIDLPRNAVMQAVSAAVVPEQRKKLLETGERATLGLPRVMFSDVLQGLGIDNRVITSAVGLAGDLVFDPLTYVGPAGWGAKATTASGRTVTWRAAGQKALSRGIKTAAKTGKVDDIAEPVVRDLLTASGMTTERISAVRAKALEDAAAGTLMDEQSLARLNRLRALRDAGDKLKSDDLKSLSTLERRVERMVANPQKFADDFVQDVLTRHVQGIPERGVGGLLKYVGGDAGFRGGQSIIGRRADPETLVRGVGDLAGPSELRTAEDVAQYVSQNGRLPDFATNVMAEAERKAVAEFLGKYGQTTRPGIKFGGGGSQIFHIPFTDIGLSVPGFTPSGRSAERIAAIIANPVAVAPDVVNGVEALGKIGSLNQGMVQQRELAEQLAGIDIRAEDLRNQVSVVSEGMASPVVPGAVEDELRVLELQREQVIGTLEETVRINESVAKDIADRIVGMNPANIDAAGLTLSDIAGLAKLRGMALTLADQSRLLHAEAVGQFSNAERAVRRAFDDQTAKLLGELYRNQSRFGPRVTQGVLSGDVRVPELPTPQEQRAFLDGLEDALAGQQARRLEDVEGRAGLVPDDAIGADDDVFGIGFTSAAPRRAYAAGYAEGQKAMTGTKVSAVTDAIDTLPIEQPYGKEAAREFLRQAFPEAMTPKKQAEIGAGIADHERRSLLLKETGWYDFDGVTMTSVSPILDSAESEYPNLLLMFEWLDREGIAPKGRGAVQGLDSARLQVGDSFSFGVDNTNRGNEFRGVVAAEDSANLYIEVSQTLAEPTVTYRVPKGKKIPAAAGSLTLYGEPGNLEQQIAGLRTRRIAQLRETERGVVSLTDEAWRANAVEIPDLLSRRAAHLLEFAKYSDGTIMEIGRQATGTDRKILDMARYLSRVDDEMLGLSLMSPFILTAERLSGSVEGLESLAPLIRRFDEASSRLFGVRGSVAGEIIRRQIGSATDSSRIRADRLASQIVSDVRDAIPASAQANIGDAMDLLTALVVQRHLDTSAMYGTGLRLDPQTGRLVETDHPIVGVIQRARAAGLAPHLNKLQKIADQYGVAMMDDLANLEMYQGLLRGKIPGYVPNVPTFEAEKIMRVTARNIAKGGGKKPTKSSLNVGEVPIYERFQKHRSTNTVRFKDADGTDHAFFEFEAGLYGDATQADIDALPELARLRATEVRKSVRAWQNLLEQSGLTPEQGAAQYSRPTDPFTLNALASEGAFSYLLGGEPPAFMATNLAEVVAKRVAQHTRAESILRFHEIMRDHRVMASQQTVNRSTVMRGSTAVTLDNGSQASLSVERIPGSNRSTTVLTINGERYRPLDRDKITSAGLSIMGNEAAGLDLLEGYYPVRLAQQIERFHEVLGKPQELNIVLEGADQLNKFWKMSTLTHPSWVVMNIMGNIVLMAQNRINPVEAGGSIGQVWKGLGMHSTDSARFADSVVSNNGFEMTMEELLARGEEFGVLTGIFGETKARIGTSRLHYEPPTGNFAQRMAAAFSDARQHELEAMRRAGAGVARQRPDWIQTGATHAKAIGAGLNEVAVRRVWGAWFSANQRMEDGMRLGLFFHLMSKGMDPASASRVVRETLLDYSDFTPFEDKTKRFLIPFYSWVRNNAAFQVNQLVQNPKTVAAVPKLVNSLEEAIAGEEQVPQHLRPRWMRDSLAIQMGRDPEDRWAFMAAQALPQGDAIALGAIAATGLSGNLLGGLQDAARYIGSSLAPSVKVPIEMASGQEIFTGRSIGPMADITPNEYLMSQFRPFRELGIGSERRGPLLRAAESGPGALVGRAVLGGRAQDFSAERLDVALRRDFSREEEEILTKIRSRRYNSADANDPDPTLDLRVRLLDLYRRMDQAGAVDMIPRWARTQLDQLGVRSDG